MQITHRPAAADLVFQAQIAPEAAVPHPAWQRARAAALEALFSGDATVLLGPPGSGKTLLLHDLARTLRNADQPVRLIEQPGALDGSRGNDILLVDEADSLGADALAALVTGPAPVLLAALPGSAGRLAGHPVRRVALDPLAPEDVARFVATRLAAAGRPRDLLEPEAVLALARYSGGSVRLVNTIGGSALFLAGWDGSARVGLRHVEEAAAMRSDFDGATPLLPTEASGPVAPPLVAVLPNYSGALLRRRAALGGMATAAGVLFALPWLTQRRSALPLQAAQAGTPSTGAPSTGAPSTGTQGVASRTVQVAQTGAGAASPAIADEGGPATAAIASPADARPALAELGARPTVLVTPTIVVSPPQAEPRRLAVLNRSTLAAYRGTALSETALLFQGSMFNETMGQGGHISLVIQRQASTGAIIARFNASQGLVGSGVLVGNVSGAGRITVSGQLLMGRNPFLCDLDGALVGDTLTGSANFARPSGGVTYHSRFSLIRA